MNEISGKYRKPLFSGVVIGMIVLGALLMLSDIRGVMSVFSRFDLRLLPLILVLAPLNYVLRFIKWSYYLRLAGLRPDPKVNRLIFMSGLSMTITPGKVGELLKCYLLREHMGAPYSTTSSIVMAERLTDGMAMVILAAFGCLAYAQGIYALLVISFFLVLALILFRFDGIFQSFSGLVGKRAFLRKFAGFLTAFQQNAKRLFTFKSLLLAVGIGVLSWGLEGLVIFLAVKAFGGDISVLGSVFVVSFSSLLGALSFLPGGLGVAEGSIMALLVFTGVGKEMAAATTLLTRFSTLWLGVGIGLVGLYLVQKELFK